jgi:hypothetical protein
MTDYHVTPGEVQEDQVTAANRFKKLKGNTRTTKLIVYISDERLGHGRYLLSDG